MFVVELWGGAISQGASAPVGIREAQFSWAYAAGWPDAEDDDTIIPVPLLLLHLLFSLTCYVHSMWIQLQRTYNGIPS